MNRASVVASLFLAAFGTVAGCQRDRRPLPDMSEWEITETPRASVTTDEARAAQRSTVLDSPAAATSIGHSPRHLLIGRACRVQFRRDALGMAVTAPLPPTSEGVGGRPAHLEGTVTAVSESWITLSRDGVAYDIPHAAILLIESRE